MNRRPKSSNEIPILGPAVGRFPGVAVRAEPEVGASRHDRRPVGRRGRDHLAARQPAGEVNPVVDRERRVAHAQLRAPGRREAGEEDAPLVGLAVAVGVAQVEHVRGAGDDQPPLPGHDAVGEGEPFGELRPPVHPPVAVGVLEPRDPADRGLALARARGIPAILGDEQPPALVERHRHRAHDERFRRHQLQPQAGLQSERLPRLLRHERAIQPRSRRGGLRRLVGRPGEPVGSQQQDDQRRREEAIGGDPGFPARSGTRTGIARTGADQDLSVWIENRGNLIIGSATRRSRPQDQQAPPGVAGPGTAGSEAPDRLTLFSTPPEVDELAISADRTRQTPSHVAGDGEAHCLDTWVGLSLVDGY